MTDRSTVLGAAIAAVLAPSMAFADGRLEGRVVAADNNTFLEGARVRIEALDRSVPTTRDGRFSFGNVPAGNYTVTVEYLGAESETGRVTVEDGATASLRFVVGQGMDEIIVRGARAGNASALNQQRNSDTVVSVVSADDIGALPDANVAEALQRVPGVFLDRDQGEGRFVGIRGIDPNLNTTTINGLLVPSPEGGARSVALDVIPSDLLEGLEVSKTFTPDMDASAIGGNINVRSLSAFDRGGRTLSLTAEASYNELVEEASPKLAGTYTDVFSIGSGTDNLGIAIAGSWFDRDLGSDNIETDGGWPSDLETDAGAVFKGAEEIEQRSYTINRERIGLAFNLDWRGENGQYYWRNLYSEFSDQEFRDRNEYKLDDGTPVSGSNSSALWEGATLEKSMKDRLEEQTILSVLVGGENYLDQWTIDYSYGYSLSEEAEPDRLDTTFVGEGINLGYATIGDIPALTAGPELTDASFYVLDEFEYLDAKTEDESNNFKLNFTYDLFSDAYNGDIRFGVHYRTREKDDDSTNIIYGGPDGATLEPYAIAGGPRYDLGSDFGLGIDAAALSNFFFTNRASLEVDEDDTLVGSTAGDFEIAEDVAAAYLMSSFERGGLRIVYGVRYEDTTFDAVGQRIVIDDVAGSGDPEARPVSFTKDYDNWLPSVNLRWETGNLVFRGAVTQTLARPNFGELSPGGEIEFETDDGENVLQAEVGNPKLDAVEAFNVDFGVEWYPGGTSVLSAGVFYKELDNFIVLADVGGTIDLTQFVGNTPVDDAEVIQPINGDSADLTGFELAFLNQFDNGFYLSANGTFVDSEASYFDRPEKTVLPRTPETILNGAIGWENEAFSLRLAATYRDDALQGFEDLTDPAFDVYQDEHLQVDLSAKWNVSEQWQLSFSAINLTDEPFYTYFGSRAFNAQYEEYGLTYSLGLRFTPF